MSIPFSGSKLINIAIGIERNGSAFYDIMARSVENPMTRDVFLFLADMVFSAWYMWERQPEMMVPSYIVFSMWIGMGIKLVLEKIKNSTSVFKAQFQYIIFSGLFVDIHTMAR